MRGVVAGSTTGVAEREKVSRGWVSYSQAGSGVADSRLDATISLSCSTVSGLGGQAGRQGRLVNPILVHSPPASASSLRPSVPPSRARPSLPISISAHPPSFSHSLRFAHIRRYTHHAVSRVSFYRQSRCFLRFLGIVGNARDNVPQN